MLQQAHYQPGNQILGSQIGAAGPEIQRSGLEIVMDRLNRLAEKLALAGGQAHVIADRTLGCEPPATECAKFANSHLGGAVGEIDQIINKAFDAADLIDVAVSRLSRL